MTQHFVPPASSPLIAPTNCCLVLLPPAPPDLAPLSRRVRADVRRNFVRILSAANIVDVPAFICSPCNQPRMHGFAGHVSAIAHREFAVGGTRAAWQQIAFREALAEQDKSALVIAGFWLEHQVVATALHALADSYDVYLVVDASPAKMRATVRLSQDRLIQAGATPVVVSQVIHEWSLESSDARKTAALNALLLSESTSDLD